MGVQFTGSLDVLGSVNTLGTSVSSLGSGEITGSLGLTGSMEIAYISSSITAGPIAWTSKSNMITQRQVLGGTGTSTAALAFGGLSGASKTNITEEYNGGTNAWSTVSGGVLSQCLTSLMGAGTTNATIAFGGSNNSNQNQTTTQLFDGSSWSLAANGMPDVKALGGGAGTQDAALAFGGFNATVSTGATYEWNGSSWTTRQAMTSTVGQGAAGTTNAALSFGGVQSSVRTKSTYEFNGTAWSTCANLNFARNALAGAGTSNAALAITGTTGTNRSLTEAFDGTSWSETCCVNTPRQNLAGAGVQNAALAFGGSDGTGATEEYLESAGPTTYTTLPTLKYDSSNGALVMNQILLKSYADDTAAGLGGIPSGGLYRTNGDIKIKL
jgi:hypothetical protein